LLDMVTEGREQRITTGKGQIFYPEVCDIRKKSNLSVAATY
jgi:hypothetical protein